MLILASYISKVVDVGAVKASDSWVHENERWARMEGILGPLESCVSLAENMSCVSRIMRGRS